MQILCVGRHPYLSEHFGRYFGALGFTTSAVTGLENAVVRGDGLSPDVVVCDYDLLATLPLEAWEQDELLARTPVIAISLTRRPNEVHLLDVNGIGGFLYLPTLARNAAITILSAAAVRNTRTLGSPIPPSLRSDSARELELR